MSEFSDDHDEPCGEMMLEWLEIFLDTELNDFVEQFQKYASETDRNDFSLDQKDVFGYDNWLNRSVECIPDEKGSNRKQKPVQEYFHVPSTSWSMQTQPCKTESEENRYKPVKEWFKHYQEGIDRYVQPYGKCYCSFPEQKEIGYDVFFDKYDVKAEEKLEYDDFYDIYDAKICGVCLAGAKQIIKPARERFQQYQEGIKLYLKQNRQFNEYEEKGEEKNELNKFSYSISLRARM